MAAPCRTVAWKLCATTRAEDVTDTLYLAPAPSGCDRPRGLDRPRLLGHDGSACIAGDFAD
ncbi:MAG: hypothetical protein AAF763_03285 [Pseudomonadota bacterium]